MPHQEIQLKPNKVMDIMHHLGSVTQKHRFNPRLTGQKKKTQVSEVGFQ